MKNKLFFLLSCIALCCSCTTIAPDTFDKEVVILIDQTDPLSVRPNASHIYASLGLSNDIYQGVRITLSYIGDMDLPVSETVALPSENKWLCNKTIRKAQVARFKNNLYQKLDSFANGAYGSKDHSIIYRSCATQLEILSSRPAKYKSLIIFSDLMENDQVSFYDFKTMSGLKYKPLSIQNELEQSMPLADLTAINIFLVYSPATYEDNSRYRRTSGFFTNVFKSKNAWVHLESGY